MEQHDAHIIDALKGFLWIVLIWWWIWGRAIFFRETPRENTGDTNRKPGFDERPPHARYRCEPSGKDGVLIGVPLDSLQNGLGPRTTSSAAPDSWHRTMAEEAMRRADATPNSWAGYVESMRIWYRLAYAVERDLD